MLKLTSSSPDRNLFLFLLLGLQRRRNERLFLELPKPTDLPLRKRSPLQKAPVVKTQATRRLLPQLLRPFQQVNATVISITQEHTLSSLRVLPFLVFSFLAVVKAVPAKAASSSSEDSSEDEAPPAKKAAKATPAKATPAKVD